MGLQEVCPPSPERATAHDGAAEVGLGEEEPEVKVEEGEGTDMANDRDAPRSPADVDMEVLLLEIILTWFI